MAKLTEDREQRRIQEAVRDYERQGYQVVLHPNGSELPDFLAGFEPDIIARRGDEAVVVEVKAREALSTSDELSALGAAIAAAPGWRLDLWLANSRSTWPVGADAKELTDREIRDRTTIIRSLLAGQQSAASRSLLADAAMLLAWATAEAALRNLADHEGIKLQQRNQPGVILKQLFALGRLTRSEYDSFQRALDLRNRIVHGYHVPGSREPVVSDLLEQVETLVENR